MTIRVIIAEDNLLVREGVRRLLETRKDASIHVVAACGDLDTVLAAVETQQPDVVLTDLRMPPTLTDEGLQIALIAKGDSNQEITRKLVVSLATIKTHISHIFGKLGAESRVQVLARARALGLLA